MGLVQGIGFRWHVASAATKLGLGGHVRNRPDGSVSLAATGQRAALESLLALFRQGPRGARVNRVEAAWSQLPGTAAPGRFEILH